MTRRLNEDARDMLKGAEVSQADWCRHAGWKAGEWSGDVCGCSDDRCIGYHHAAHEECECLRNELARFLVDRHAAKARADLEQRGVPATIIDEHLPAVAPYPLVFRAVTARHYVDEGARLVVGEAIEAALAAEAREDAR